MSEIDRFVEKCKEMIGEEVDEIRMIEPYPLDAHRIREFSWALGDDNPLFTDPAYAAKTKYGCLIANPTILAMVRYPMSHGVLFQGPWELLTFFSGNKFEWFNVIRVGDRLRSSLKLKDVILKKGKSGPLVFFKTEGSFWNQHEELVGKQYGTLITVKLPEGKTFGDHLIYEREIHRYSKEEIDRIVNGIKSEIRRGSNPRYWEEVKIGERLQPVVKGPMHIGDMILWRLGAFPLTPTGSAGITPGGSFELAFRDTVKLPGVVRLNPRTAWPYDHIEWEHEDFTLAHYRGLPGPFDLGVMRTELAAHLLTNWMSDYGFLRRMNVEIRKPNYYGDTTWFKGEVVKKYKSREGKFEYGAVDIKFSGVNQLGEVTTPGDATVYLPSLGRDLKLPIPHES